ncbi:hypothetical protein RHMOL_Rhmol11G0139900 [Rhododendron molle]|uniref:Uncharacterized protein n=1 Tax=Rhododendron molle TaxID=49168 RepID=A0ACC0LS48_RHOML|nr:hypothetical protein RHMOL_Rhmol11G0139900 [Rhododendron molle]
MTTPPLPTPPATSGSASTPPSSTSTTHSLPLIVYFHGGGFFNCVPNSFAFDALCRQFSRNVPAAVVSMNYRRAPEQRCPAPHEDGFDTLKFIDDPPERRCFAAGGNLARHVAIRSVACKINTGVGEDRDCYYLIVDWCGRNLSRYLLCLFSIWDLRTWVGLGLHARFLLKEDVMKKKTGKKTVNKEEICEDWCFVCKDGGLLYTCDYKQCLKAYHARCVGKDEPFFDSGNRWSCKWHSCFMCHNRSKFHCFCCPNAVCKRCMINMEFSCVRGEKGFCNHCLKLALLSEENVDVDSDGEQIDFKDRETYEGLFMEYWEIIKKQEGLTLEDLRFAYAQLKKGENFKSDPYIVESEEDEDIQLRSDYEDEDDVEKRKPMKKIKKSKGQQLLMKRKVVSNKREFVGWGSKSLIDFLASIGKDTSTELSQVQVSNIITAYINENRLFDSEKKRKILCDDRLKSVLGRKTVNRNKIYDLLEPHFVDNLEPSEDEFEYSSEDKNENVLMACKKQKKLSTCRKFQEKEVFNAPQSCFASITSENIKLVYLRRSLVQELLKQLGNFEGKLLGSFVRVKSEFIDFTQRSSHQLLEVTGLSW